MTTTRPNTVPSPDDIRGLQQAAIDHLFVGTRNAAQLAEDGGPMIVNDADGIYFTDSTGRQYVDGISGMYFRNAGHGRDEIAEAIYEQLKQVSMHVYVASTSSTVRLAARLAQIAPGGLTRTFFTSGGSESNETSIKMAQAYHNRTGGKGRFKVISRKGSYHGGTWGTMWLGSHPFLPREEYQPVPSHAVHVPNPNPYRCELGGSTPEECAELCANAVEEAILFHHPDSVSAVIGEPITQPLGGVVPGPGYWDRVREICDKYGVLLIFDEVITGFGRTGDWFGADTVGVVPDIMSFAKGVTSGYFPMGGSIATAEVSDVFSGGPDKTFKHMFTYTGHPAGAAGAMANLDIMEREDLPGNARQRGEQLGERLQEMMEKHPSIGDVRGLGLIQGIEFVKDRDTKEHFGPEVDWGPRITQALVDRGIWIRVGAYILPLAPPLMISADEIDALCTAIDESITEVETAVGVG